MYGENKPSTLINDDPERPNFFRALPVRSAMPKIYFNSYMIPKSRENYLILYICHDIYVCSDGTNIHIL